MFKTFATALLTATVFAADLKDKMGNLPNAPNFTTNTYSGYLTVTETKSLHYVFAESMSDPANDPVVIWFNGGPGCSSMLAFMQENGPLAVDDGEDYIKTNPYPWNTRANMLWIESPAGVGYSLAGTEEDLQQNDMTQSEDAYAALTQWFGKFPEYLPNKLFVSGESYGGIYVPYLTWQIYQHNQQAAFKSDILKMNLGGMMVGNGATNWSVDVEPSFPATVRFFNIIPPKLYDDFEANNCHFYFYPGYSKEIQTPKCDYLWEKINNLTSDLNWYDLYRKVYPSTLLDKSKALKQSNRVGQAMIDGKLKTYKKGYTMSEYTPWVKHLKQSSEEVILGDYLSDYMNRQDVREAFHVPSDAPGWEMCSSRLQYHEQHEASMWIYPILRNKYQLLFYSGDTDGAVATYGSKQWIQILNWPVQEEWRPWFTEGQVSGYVERYDGLDFVTVKGVGHMAPQWARQPVTNMITAWIHGEDF